MAFMRPEANYMVCYRVETNSHNELVPEEVCGPFARKIDEAPSAFRVFSHFRGFIEGKEIYSVDREEGWYARLSANGYLDCTDYDGPYKTEQEALDACKEFYEVDDNGNDLEGT